MTAPPRPTETSGAEPPRTGAFAGVRVRWLPVWALIGLLVVVGVEAAVEEIVGSALPDELEAILLYGVILAWVAVMVVRRGAVNLPAMLRWPGLGSYWFIVAGLLVIQLIFSLAAILITQLVAPWLTDSVAGVGQGNLVLAFIGLAVLPPLVEEVLFRGVLVERFTVKWRVGVAIVVSAVFFGILHADPVGAGMFGLITGLLYVRTGSLWPGIIIHAANNVVALTAVRLSGPEDEAPPLEVAETLATAGVLLAVSLPFLVWFIMRTWPSPVTPTPYQRYELAYGLPARTIRGVRWSGSRALLSVTVTGTQVTLLDTSGAAVAVLPLTRIRTIYPTPAPGGQQVVILLKDGSWTTLLVPPGTVRPTQQMVRTLGERAGLADGADSRPPAAAHGVLGGNPPPHL